MMATGKDKFQAWKKQEEAEKKAISERIATEDRAALEEKLEGLKIGLSRAELNYERDPTLGHLTVVETFRKNLKGVEKRLRRLREKGAC